MKTDFKLESWNITVASILRQVHVHDEALQKPMQYTVFSQHFSSVKNSDKKKIMIF